MLETFVHSSWATVSEGCPMRGVVEDSNATTFTFGNGRIPFELSFDAETLGQFSEMAVKAVAEMSRREALEETDEQEARMRTVINPRPTN